MFCQNYCSSTKIYINVSNEDVQCSNSSSKLLNYKFIYLFIRDHKHFLMGVWVNMVRPK